MQWSLWDPGSNPGPGEAEPGPGWNSSPSHRLSVNRHVWAQWLHWEVFKDPVQVQEKVKNTGRYVQFTLTRFIKVSTTGWKISARIRCQPQMTPGFTLTWILKLTSSYFVMLKGEFSGQNNCPKLSKNNSSQCFLNPLTISLLAWEFHTTSSCLINTKKLACLSKYYKTGFCILTLYSRILTVNIISTPPKKEKSYNSISILSLSYSWAKSWTEKQRWWCVRPL